LCELGAEDRGEVEEVTVSQDGAGRVNLPVRALGNYTQDRGNTTQVCVRSLYGPYDNTEQLGQFLSYYSSVLGVSFFSFYLLDVSDRVKYLLGSLQEATHATGVEIDVVDWELPTALRSWDKLWDYGALASLTDCLYRGMAAHQHTILVDLDEFIVPRGEAAVQGGPGLLATAMARVRLPANKSAHAFLFSNSFFCSEFNNETAGPTFNIFDHPFRENIVWNYKLRAKILVMTREAIAAGHHRIHDWVRPDVSHNSPVSSNLALLHHYRSCHELNSGFAELGAPVLRNPRTEDRAVFRYRHTVINSPVSRAIETIFIQ